MIDGQMTGRHHKVSTIGHLSEHGPAGIIPLFTERATSPPQAAIPIRLPQLPGALPSEGQVRLSKKRIAVAIVFDNNPGSILSSQTERWPTESVHSLDITKAQIPRLGLGTRKLGVAIL